MRHVPPGPFALRLRSAPTLVPRFGADPACLYSEFTPVVMCSFIHLTDGKSECGCERWDECDVLRLFTVSVFFVVESMYSRQRRCAFVLVHDHGHDGCSLLFWNTHMRLQYAIHAANGVEDHVIVVAAHGPHWNRELISKPKY